MALLQGLLDDQDAAMEAAWKAEAEGQYAVAEAFKTLAWHLGQRVAETVRKGV